MATVTASDLFDGAAHRAMAAHLTAPFAAGAVDTTLAVQPNGTVAVTVAVREPVLLVAPKTPLSDRWMVVDAVLDPAGVPAALTPALRFAPYTEAGTFLPLYAPAVDPQLRTTPPFTVRLTLTFVDRDLQPIAVPVADVSTHVEVRLLEGALGKMLYVLGAEKARVRRQARELSAVRALTDARWNALDRLGADVAVPRFVDELRYDSAKQEIYTVVPTAGGVPVPETDAAYRRRLRLYVPWLMPTRSRLVQLLADVGAPAAFGVEEQTNEFAVGIHIIAAPGQAAARQNFDDFLRRNILVWPTVFPATDPREQRFLNARQKQRLDDLRTSLRNGYNVTNQIAFAPALAAALDRLARLRSAAGGAGKLTVSRAFDPASGSRYELGLGADLQPIPAAQLNAMHAALTAATPPTSTDPEIAALLRAVQSQPAAADPEGKWLFEAAGLRTVHRIGGGDIHVSPLPTFGLVVSESAVQPDPALRALEARYHAPGDPGANAVLEAALTAGAAEWAAAAHEPWTRITDADARARWNLNTAQPAAARNVFAAAGLAAVTSLPALATALNNVPLELLEGIQLGPVLTGRILANDPAAVAELRALTTLFRNHNLSSMLPFVSGPSQITVLVGAIGLPTAGINLSDRLATGFRWYAVPIQGAGGEVKSVGARSAFRPKSSAVLTAIVVIGYARRGLVDPYEFRVDLPPGAILTLPQYEFLMNALERVCPIGVQANTYAIRQQHVDVDASGAAEPLPPSLSRTYRKFRRPHQRGEVGVGAAGA